MICSCAGKFKKAFTFAVFLTALFFTGCADFFDETIKPSKNENNSGTGIVYVVVKDVKKIKARKN